MPEKLVIEYMGHRGDGVAEAADGPIYVPVRAAGRDGRGRAGRRPSRPPPSRCTSTSRARAHRADLPAFRRVRRLRHAALARWRDYRAWKRDLVVEALAAGRLDRAGRRSDRCPWRRPPPRGPACPARHARRARSRLLRRRAPTTWSPIDRCPILAPRLDGAIEAAWAIAEVLDPAGKPLDIQVTATDAGLDIDVRGSGPLTSPLHDGAGARRRAARSRAAHPPRRTGGAARAPTVRIGKRDRDPAAGGVPASDRDGRSRAGAAGPRRVRGRQKYRRSVRRHRPVRAAACRERARSRRRQRRSRDRARSSARPRPPPGSSRSTASAATCSAVRFVAAELNRFDAVVFDPPRQGAQAQARELAASARAARSSRCPAMPRRSRATPRLLSTAATGSSR